MNTSAPGKKQTIAEILRSSGVQFVDLAIMAPVPPRGIRTPFLACGEGAEAFYRHMQPLGLDITLLEGRPGDAATKKLLRSIVYKGMAAVICEAMESGLAFGMETYIREQIRSLTGASDDLIDRFVEGSITHAERRMHEMEAVMEMLAGKGIEPIMAEATRNNLSKLHANRHSLHAFQGR